MILQSLWARARSSGSTLISLPCFRQGAKAPFGFPSFRKKEIHIHGQDKRESASFPFCRCVWGVDFCLPKGEVAKPQVLTEGEAKGTQKSGCRGKPSPTVRQGAFIPCIGRFVNRPYGYTFRQTVGFGIYDEPGVGVNIYPSSASLSLSIIKPPLRFYERAKNLERFFAPEQKRPCCLFCSCPEGEGFEKGALSGSVRNRRR